MSSRNLCWYWSDLFQNLLVTRTCIILWMSSNFGQIGPPTTELAALEHLRNTPIDLIMGKMVFPLFLCCFWSDPFDTCMYHEQALKLGWVWIFWNEIWPWHIGLRWAIVALWATCYFIETVGDTVIVFILFPCLSYSFFFYKDISYTQFSFFLYYKNLK